MCVRVCLCVCVCVEKKNTAKDFLSSVFEVPSFSAFLFDSFLLISSYLLCFTSLSFFYSLFFCDLCVICLLLFSPTPLGCRPHCFNVYGPRKELPSIQCGLIGNSKINNMQMNQPTNTFNFSMYILNLSNIFCYV